ncbi:MAG: hypothetical protein HY320_11020 [Armatimonadetes bacterium]|nr:hypothetical protein [Armatimonadota bacterium]
MKARRTLSTAAILLLVGTQSILRAQATMHAAHPPEDLARQAAAIRPTRSCADD